MLGGLTLRGRREGGGGDFAVIEAATPVLDGTAPLICFFRLFQDLAHGSRNAPCAKTRDEKVMSLFLIFARIQEFLGS